MLQAAGSDAADTNWDVYPTYTLAIGGQTMTESEIANAILRTASDETRCDKLPGKRAALRRVPLYSSIPHSHGRWRPISLRYKNAPIIAPTTGASSGTRK